MLYIEEHDLDFDALTAKADTATIRYNDLSAKIKAAEKRMTEIAVLKTHIINYSNARNVYARYKTAGYSKKYLPEHENDIMTHKAAKKAFDELGLKKLPTVKTLQAEYSKLLTGKRRRMPTSNPRRRKCVSCSSIVRTWFGSSVSTLLRSRKKKSMTGASLPCSISAQYGAHPALGEAVQRALGATVFAGAKIVGDKAVGPSLPCLLQ